MVIVSILALSLLSCSTDETPTTPNFETVVPDYVWDYNHVIWFYLDYFNPTKGLANVEIVMSAKGENPNATLKIGTQNITFEDITSSSEGKVYYGGEIDLNTEQPVSYEIVNNGKTYSGNISALPREISVSTWPTFTENINYSASWAITPDPDFHVITAYAGGTDPDLYHIRQIEGDVKTYTLLQSFWAPVIPVEWFEFVINAISYERMNSNKVLIVGQTETGYNWPDKAKGVARQPFRFLEQIRQDIGK